MLGSWLATHSQRHLSEPVLRSVLGVSNLAVGLLYVLAYLGLSPVRI